MTEELSEQEVTEFLEGFKCASRDMEAQQLWATYMPANSQRFRDGYGEYLRLYFHRRKMGPTWH